MGYKSTTPAVLNHLQHNADTNLTVTDIAAATGLNTGQVQASMRSLIARGTLPIDVLVPSQMWRLNVNGTPNPGLTQRQQALRVNLAEAQVTPKPDTKFEAVGVTSTDEVIVKGNNSGKLFKLTAL